jgi:hypothetical protein
MHSPKHISVTRSIQYWCYASTNATPIGTHLLKEVELKREEFPSDLDNRLSLDTSLGGIRRPLASMGRAFVVDFFIIVSCVLWGLPKEETKIPHFRCLFRYV